MSAILEDLMLSPFSKLSIDKKIKLIKNGKPRPVINEYVTINSKDVLVSELYDQEIWLTASEELDSIICWTCLLFPLTDSKRNTTCFIANIADEKLYETILCHKKSLSHRSGLLKYLLFSKENLLHDDNQMKEKLEQEISYKRHRDIFRNLISTVIFLIETEFIPVKITGDSQVLHTYYVQMIDNCSETLKGCDTSYIHEENINKIRKCPKIITKVLEVIIDIIKMSIKKEIQLCSCVSLILTECSKNSKLSVVLRYVYNGNVIERFIDFIDSMDKNVIENRIPKIISEYGISSKLLSVSWNGGVLTYNNMCTLLEILQKKSPFCILAPCYFHDIRSILEQKLSKLEGCEIFFTIINSMKMFIQDNVKLCEILTTFIKDIPNLFNLKLNNVQFLRIFKVYRCQFKQFFSHVVENCNMDNEELFKVHTFQTYLEKYQIIFMTEAFYVLFNHVAVLSDLLNSGSPEKAFDDNVLDSVKAVLIKEKTKGFENLWKKVINELIEDCNPQSFTAVEKDQTDALLELYLKAVDCILEEINVRFGCFQKLEFLSVLNCVAHNKLLVLDYQMEQIEELYGKFIDIKQAIIEMKVLSKNGWIFGGKSVSDFMDILTKMSLKSAFRNIYRLGEIILTLPCKPISCSKVPSKFDIIDDWVSKSNVADMKSLNLLAIERDYLTLLKSHADFNENVNLKLREINSDIQVMFEN